jgi:uncharacterized membrane protein YgcG
VTTRRLTSRKVVLTAAFLALAAGGTAACDAASDDPGLDHDVAQVPRTTVTTTPTTTATRKPTATARPSKTAPSPRTKPTTPPPAEDAFYCADGDGMVVEEYYCDPDDSYEQSSYFLWYSSGYQRGYDFGTVLPSGGRRLAPDDPAARKAAGLPTTGVIGNGSIKTNIVGARSGSSPAGGGSTTNGGFDGGDFSAGG